MPEITTLLIILRGCKTMKEEYRLIKKWTDKLRKLHNENSKNKDKEEYRQIKKWTDKLRKLHNEN